MAANEMLVDIGHVIDLSGRLRDSTDADVRELARAAYEVADALNSVWNRLSMFDFGSDDGGE